jgi:hypothetical protein
MEGAKDVLERIQQLFPLQITGKLKVNDFEASKRE